MEESNNIEIEYEGWHVVRRIGTGSFGAVYEIEREDFGYTYKSALKVISIPKSEQELIDVKNNVGKSEDSLKAYYQSVASEIVKEFELMYQLRGTTNIVSYEDHKVRKHASGIGWDILIRMELLTPLDVYMEHHRMTRQDIIRLGIDICKALERCRALDVIHRDIKPGNIFISEQGDFKLGDFGIARTIEAYDDVLELSRKGTISYMAPEIFKGMQYSFDVDIYSLGIVMYRLLNDNSLPFMPQQSLKPTYKDVANANQLRLKGERLPYPSGDHTQLAEIVLKACSYRPKERYQNPQTMREQLEKVLRGEKIEDIDYELIHSESLKVVECPYCHVQLSWDSQFCTNCGRKINYSGDTGNTDNEVKNEISKSKFLISGIILLVIIVGIGAYAIGKGRSDDLEDYVAKSESEALTESTFTEQSETTKVAETIENTEAKETETEATNNVLTDTEESVQLSETEIATEMVIEPEHMVREVTMDDISDVYATSYLVEERLGFYHKPANVIDGDNATAWVEDADGQGEGESLTIELDDTYAVSGFIINAGYQKNTEVYDNNSRPKELIVTFSDGQSFMVELDDYYGAQKVVLDSSIETTSVTFTINDVYPGGKYEDTVISEIQLF